MSSDNLFICVVQTIYACLLYTSIIKKKEYKQGESNPGILFWINKVNRHVIKGKYVWFILIHLKLDYIY